MVLSNVSVAKNSELNVSCVVHTNQNLRFSQLLTEPRLFFLLEDKVRQCRSSDLKFPKIDWPVHGAV